MFVSDPLAHAVFKICTTWCSLGNFTFFGHWLWVIPPPSGPWNSSLLLFVSWKWARAWGRGGCAKTRESDSAAAVGSNLSYRDSLNFNDCVWIWGHERGHVGVVVGQTEEGKWIRILGVIWDRLMQMRGKISKMLYKVVGSSMFEFAVLHFP